MSAEAEAGMASASSATFERQVNAFLNEWGAEEILTQYIRERMQQLRVRPTHIGIVDEVESGKAFSLEHYMGGRNTRPAWSGAKKGGINVDPGIFNPDLLSVPSWRSASLRARIDAVIIHELMEYNSRAGRGALGTALRHRSAVMRSPFTKAEIAPDARKILEEYRLLMLGKGR